MATWYRRAAERGDYAARVLEAIEPRLRHCETLLDVGAGCGALAVPLARRLRAVTALEPSPAMAGELRAWAAETGLGNLTVVEGAWGVPVEPHDVVVCAHVGSLLRDPGFPRQAGRHARQLVVLVRDLAPAEADRDKFFFRELYPILLGRPYPRRREPADPVAALRARGIHADVTQISYRSDQPFADLEEACEFWMTYLGRSDPGARAYLGAFLRERLVRLDGEWIAPFRKSAAVITWSAGPAPRGCLEK